MENKQALRIIREMKGNYNLIARDWNNARNGSPAPLKIKLLRQIRPGWRVLDLGCGNGFALPEVIRRGGKYVGLDYSKNLLALARKKYAAEIKKGKAKFVLSEATKLPFKDSSFDFVFSFAVAHHLPSEEARLKFFKEIFRVLEKGGRAEVDVWNLFSQPFVKRMKVKERIAERPAGFGPRDLYIPWKATAGKIVQRYFHIFTKKEIIALAKKAGFKKIRADFYRRDTTKDKNGEALMMMGEK